MKKKLEADLVSIAHRILKQKNREELDQLLQETLKLYEKLLVLKFVEEQFGDAEPTIGHASALFKLEETYGLEEPVHVKANEFEAKEEAARAKKAEEKTESEHEETPAEDKENKDGEGIVTEPTEEEAASDVEKKETEESGEEVPAQADAPKAETGNAPKDDKKEEAEEEVIAEESGNDEAEPVPVEEEAEADAETQEEATKAADEEDAIEEESQEQTAQPTPAEEEPLKEEIPKEEPKPEQPEVEEPTEEPEVKVEVVKPEETTAAEEKSAAAVFENTHNSTPEEEEKAADAEIKTIAPDANAKVEESKIGFDFAYERKPAPEEPVQQKEISFEDFRDYKEPEFVKKEAWPADFEAPKTPVPPEVKEELKAADDDWQNWEPKKSEADTPKAAPKFDWEANLETPKAPAADDWKNWEPAKSAEPEKPATPPSFNWNEPEPAEPKQGFSWEEPKKELIKEEKPAAPKTLNDSFGKTISLALNDRIAFEKHLFAGSSDDLNRVISQLNTLNSQREAQNFIEDLVKPDYNNWVGKEEYEERFMAIVEKRFN